MKSYQICKIIALVLLLNLVPSRAECQLDIDHIEFLRDCVLMHWSKSLGCSNTLEPPASKLYVDDCNGKINTYDVPEFTTTPSAFPRSHCESYCIIRLKGIHTCWVFNKTATAYYDMTTNQLVDRECYWNSKSECIAPQSLNAQCHYEIYLYSISTHESKIWLLPTCINTIENNLNISNGFRLKTYCNGEKDFGVHPGCKVQQNDPVCQSLIMDPCVITAYPAQLSGHTSESGCTMSEPLNSTCQNYLSLDGQSIARNTEHETTDNEYQSTPNSASHSTSCCNSVFGILVAIFSCLMCTFDDRPLHSKITLIVLIAILYLVQVSLGAVRFGERDVLVREGLQRSVAVDRTDSSSYLGIKVFASTIEAYRQRSLTTHGCNMTLDEIGVSDNQVDHTEDADFIVLEYELAFQADIREVTFNLELYDDILSEKEELFILFLNYSESSTDNCAIAVRTLDNDWLMFNFSTSQDITISEDVGTFRNLSIIKIGQNEPDVTINIYTPGNLEGQDFMFDQEYTFDANTTKQIVLLDIIDDTLVESRESFLLCLPTLGSTNSDVQLVTETSPSCVTIYIQDNEVARVGFKNTSDIMIQEGQRAAAMICAGFVDMENITVDNFVYVSLEINITAINPGSGHEPYFLPYSSYFLDESSPIDCLYIHSHFDSNLEESHFVLSLILDTAVNTVMISIMQQFTNVNLFITDFHGISFISQPSTVVTGVGKEAHFDCTYIGTNANPLWNITDFNNISRIVSTTRLPVDHFHSGSGLALENIDESQNMTSYSCFFQVYDRDEIVILASEVGTLIVLETITFRLQVNNYVPLSSGHEYIIYEGEDAPEVSVIKTGYSTNVFCVPLIIKSLNEDQTTISEVDVENYCLSGTTNKLTLPLLSEYVQENPSREKLKTFLLEIDESIGSTSSEQTGACIEVVNEPLSINIYDNDFLVGFTESNITIDEGTTYNICLTMFEKERFDKHFNASIDLTVSSYHPYLEFNLTEEVVTLNNANNYYGCFSNTFNLVGQCVGQKNITVNVLWVENHKYSVSFLNASINVMINPSMHCSEDSSRRPSIIAILVVIGTIIGLFLTVVIFFTILWIKCKRQSKSLSSVERD